MTTIKEMIRQANENGYIDDNAEAKVWMIFQRIPIPLKDGIYRFIPGADLHYSGNFPLWRMSYYMVGIMRDMFEQFGTSFQALFKVKKEDEIPYIPYEKWAVFIGDMTPAIIVKRNMQPMIDNIWNTRAPEDYSEYYSRIKANFESQWFHERTNVGKGMHSIEEMMEASDENGIRFDVPDKKDYTEEVINRMAWERFTSTLSKRDREILDLKAKGFTDKEIAEKVGYKTHSAVVNAFRRLFPCLKTSPGRITGNIKKHLMNSKTKLLICLKQLSEMRAVQIEDKVSRGSRLGILCLQSENPGTLPGVLLNFFMAEGGLYSVFSSR